MIVVICEYRTIDEGLNEHTVKSSQSKGVRKSLIDLYPSIEDNIDDIWPKKTDIKISKMKGYYFW